MSALVEQAVAENPETTKTSEVIAYEGFRAVALRAASRGQRVLPIMVGAKNPAIKWKGTKIDTASSQDWVNIFPAWIDRYANQYPDAAVAVLAKPNEFLFVDEDESERFRTG